jgi:hypothetical protein
VNAVKGGKNFSERRTILGSKTTMYRVNNFPKNANTNKNIRNQKLA